MHLQELIHKLTTGQIRLRVLDLRGLEVVLTPQWLLLLFCQVKMLSLITYL